MRGISTTTAQGTVLAAQSPVTLDGNVNQSQHERTDRSSLKFFLRLLAALIFLAGYLTTASAATLTQIFPADDPWKYDPACHDGDNWQTTLFDDSTWLSGPGGFTGGETAAGIVPILHTTTLPAPGGQ